MRSTMGPTVALSLSPSSGQGTQLSRRKVLVKSAPGKTLCYSAMTRLEDRRLSHVFIDSFSLTHYQNVKCTIDLSNQTFLSLYQCCAWGAAGLIWARCPLPLLFSQGPAFSSWCTGRRLRMWAWIHPGEPLPQLHPAQSPTPLPGEPGSSGTQMAGLGMSSVLFCPRCCKRNLDQIWHTGGRVFI